MINLYAYLSQVIIWSMTFFLTSQIVFNEAGKSAVLAIIPISFSVAAMVSTVLIRYLSSVDKRSRFFLIITGARIITILPIFFVSDVSILLFLYFLQCILFHSSFPFEVAYVSSDEDRKKRELTSNWQIAISAGKLSAPIVISDVSPFIYNIIIIICAFLLLISSVFLKSYTQMNANIKIISYQLKEIVKYKSIIYMGVYFIPISLAASLYGVLVKDCGLNANQFAVILSVSSLGNIVGSALYKCINTITHTVKCILIFSSMIGFGFIFFGLAKLSGLSIPILYASAFLVGVSMALMIVFIIEMIQGKYKDSELIASSSLNNSAQLAASIIGAAIMPILHLYISASMVFVLCGIVIIVINSCSFLYLSLMTTYSD